MNRVGRGRHSTGRAALVFAAGAWLGGCGVIADFGGQELEEDTTEIDGVSAMDDYAPESDSPLAGLFPGVGSAWCPSDGEAGVEATGGAGVIDVLHVGVDGPCDAEWDVVGHDAGPDAIELTYTDLVASGTDCVCTWTFDYQLAGLGAATWSLVYDGETVASAEVQ